MKQAYSFLIVFGLILLACKSPEINPYTPKFEISDNPPYKIKEDQAYTFGYLEVPENRSKPNGATIKLPVYIFKSRNKNPKKDPVVVLGGGPGRSMMRNAPYMKWWVYLDDRDLILFEQRGTTYAQPNLACPELSAAIRQTYLPGITEEEGDRLKREAALSCKNRLENAGIDLNAYTTMASAADINDLMDVLDIPSYNIYAMSYGTKIAQVLMRDSPDKIRSVIMDSPLPLEANYDEESLNNLVDTYKTVFADCESDPQCNNRFPGIEQRFFTFLEKVELDPLVIKVKNPETKKKETFFLKGQDLVYLLSTLKTDQMVEIPLLIDQIMNEEYAFLKSYLESLFEPAGKGNGLGMRLSVWCAEETAFIDKSRLKPVSFLPNASPILYEPEICQIWGVKKAHKTENEAITSTIPTLLISGSYDNETPVKWAQQIHQNLPNSFHLIFKGYHHGPTTYWSNQCAMRMANQFLNQPDSHPESDCFEDIGTPKFKLK